MTYEGQLLEHQSTQKLYYIKYTQRLGDLTCRALCGWNVREGRVLFVLVPSSWVWASPATPSAPGCAPHPTPSVSGSRVQSAGGISHSDKRKNTAFISQLQSRKMADSMVTVVWMHIHTWSCWSSRTLVSHCNCRSLIWFSCFWSWCNLSFLCLFSSWAANWEKCYI